MLKEQQPTEIGLLAGISGDKGIVQRAATAELHGRKQHWWTCLVVPLELREC